MSTRFPFTSFPEGWFVIAFSSEIPAGTVKTVHYFGTDLVLFRTLAGQLSALDKTCPHLGAHLGGGRVDGGCLRCPFHDWAFDAEGHCVEVPYAPKIPPRAAVRAWPLLEQNGVVLVHYSADRRAPTWQPPLLPDADWTPNRTIRWEIRSHPQEVAENTVDCAHLGPVHHVLETRILEVEQREHWMRVLLHLHATGQAIGMPEEINDVHLDVTLHGLGVIKSETHVLTSGMRTRQRIHPTPIDGERIAIFAVANTQQMPDAAYTAEIDQIFWEAFTHDFARDFPIWENKAYLERPLLAGGDGPIGTYRKWCRQFYAGSQQADQTAPSAPAPATPLGRLAPLRSKLAQWSAELAPALLARLPVALQARLGRTPATTPHEDDAGSSPRPAAAAAPPAAAPTRRFASVQDYFDSLPRRFDAKVAGDLDAVFQWVFVDAPELQHFAEVHGGQLQTQSGRHEQPTLTIEMTSADYLKMINGELNGALAFSTGRGRLSGPVKLAMRMQRIFPLDAR